MDEDERLAEIRLRQYGNDMLSIVWEDVDYLFSIIDRLSDDDERIAIFDDVIVELHRVRAAGCGWPNREFVIAHIEAIRDGREGCSRGDGSYTAAPTPPRNWSEPLERNQGE